MKLKNYSIPIGREQCSSSATPVQKVEHQLNKLHIVILDYDYLKENRKFSKPMISRNMMEKIQYGNFEKGFLV